MKLTKTKIVLLSIAALIVLGMVLPKPPQTTTPATATAVVKEAAPATPHEPDLLLIGYTFEIDHGYAILEGQVKNVSDHALKNVEAVGTFYDSGGNFITSSDALIAYNPILPGQTSPFKVMETENPAMKKAGVEFKALMGGTIPFKQAVKKKK